MSSKLKSGALIILIAAFLGTVGCTSFSNRTVRSTSVMQFLYPKEPDRIERTVVPVLSLPLRVGVAFVPSGSGNQASWMPDSTLPEARKQQLMKQVAAQFRELPYVASIEVIPSAYLRPQGSFANIDQLKSMFNVDVIALISYDQIQFTDQSVFSLAYWTIVGAYIVQGERNDTQTLMDTVVFDIGSRHLLFRAPGTSQVKASATPVNQSEALRTDSDKGFDLATGQMIENLKIELAGFRERVKQQPDEIQIVHKPGYVGTGNFGLWSALALAGAAAWAGRTRKQS